MSDLTDADWLRAQRIWNNNNDLPYALGRAVIDAALRARVAAALECDESAGQADLRNLVSAPSDWENMRVRTAARLDAGWRLVPPAPPAGHGDEDAAEPAIAWRQDSTGKVTTDAAVANRWADDDFDTVTVLVDRDALVVALAAARGPRTEQPDGA